MKTQIYTDSKGRDHEIASMPYPFLFNALNKAIKERPAHPVTLALAAEFRRRPEAKEVPADEG